MREGLETCASVAEAICDAGHRLDPARRLIGMDHEYEVLIADSCAANNITVAIPCHRVVRNDGALSDYVWGIDRKRQLLDREPLETA